MLGGRIYDVIVAGHTRKAEFQTELVDAAQKLQSAGLEIEVQYAGKQHGYYSALVIGRAAT